MEIAKLIHGYLEILVWPIVALITLFIMRPHLGALLSNSKVTLSIFDQKIETTLPKLKQAIEEHDIPGILTPRQIEILKELQIHGVKDYPNGIETKEQKLLRPMRNVGLIMTVPKDAPLTDASAVQLSVLGRLYLGARPEPK